MKTFGQRIEDLRKSKHLSREELSSKLGIKSTVLRDLEILNSSPRGLAQLIPMIARELGTSIQFILTGETSRNTEAVLKHVTAIKDHADLILQKIND